MVWGAVIGAGMSLLGMHKQEKANERASEAYAASKADALESWHKGAVSAQQAWAKGQAVLQRSYQDAENALRGAGASARRDIDRFYKQSSAAASQAVGDRGLRGTSVANVAERGVQADTAHALGKFWGQHGQARSQVHMAKGAALAQYGSQMGESDYLRQLDRAQIHLGPQAPAPSGIAESYGKMGGLFGDALDSYLDSRPDPVPKTAASTVPVKAWSASGIPGVGVPLPNTGPGLNPGF